MISILALIISGVMVYCSLFKKKLLCLLSLELMMISLVFLFLILGFSTLGEKSSFLPFLLTCFMVLDSTLGISFLICCSRSSYFLSSVLG